MGLVRKAVVVTPSPIMRKVVTPGVGKGRDSSRDLYHQLFRNEIPRSLTKTMAMELL